MPTPSKKQVPNNQIEAISRLINFRLTLLKNGYEPIPLRGKRPSIDEWNAGDITEGRIFSESMTSWWATNTGLRTGKLVAFDLDLYDEADVKLIKRIIFANLKPTNLQRIGSKGIMLLYHTETPFDKIYITDKTTKKSLVEIFGINHQIASFGIHPDTLQPYRWIVPGCDPSTVPLEQLPLVTLDQVYMVSELVHRALALQGHDTRTHQQNVTPRYKAGTVADAGKSYTKFFLERLPGVPGPKGLNFTCPACHCSRGWFKILGDGGFIYRCPNTGCQFNKSVSFSPTHKNGPNDRARELFVLLGGDVIQLSPYRFQPWFGSMIEAHEEYQSMMKRR